nr:MAG TPA: hypothetical protein [Caudoviricetes sp.]
MEPDRQSSPIRPRSLANTQATGPYPYVRIKP